MDDTWLAVGGATGSAQPQHWHFGLQPAQTYILVPGLFFILCRRFSPVGFNYFTYTFMFIFMLQTATSGHLFFFFFLGVPDSGIWSLDRSYSHL